MSWRDLGPSLPTRSPLTGRDSLRQELVFLTYGLDFSQGRVGMIRKLVHAFPAATLATICRLGAACWRGCGRRVGCLTIHDGGLRLGCGLSLGMQCINAEHCPRIKVGVVALAS